MNSGEPLNEEEAEQMMKEADKDGDGTIDYEGEKIFSTVLPIIKTSQFFFFVLHSTFQTLVQEYSLSCTIYCCP